MRRLLTITLCLLAAHCSTVQADHHLKPVDLTGVWHAKAESDQGSRKIVWTFERDGKSYTGESEDLENGTERKLDRIKVNEKAVTLEVDMEQDGQKGVIVVDAKEKTPGKLAGKWRIEDGEGTELMGGDISAWKEVKFAGEWDTKAEMADGNTLDAVLVLKGKNAKLEGMIKGDTVDIKLDEIESEERGIELEFDFDMNGANIETTIEAQAEGDNKLTGQWSVPNPDGGKLTGKWSAVRKKTSLAGEWKVEAAVPDAANYEGTMKLAMEAGKYSGTQQSGANEPAEIKSMKYDGKEVELAFPFSRDGFTGTIEVAAELQEDGSLKGNWKLVGDDGNEVASDWWKAVRK